MSLFSLKMTNLWPFWNHNFPIVTERSKISYYPLQPSHEPHLPACSPNNPAYDPKCPACNPNYPSCDPNNPAGNPNYPNCNLTIMVVTLTILFVSTYKNRQKNTKLSATCPDFFGRVL